MRRQSTSRYQGIGSGVLEANHYGAFLNKLYVDYIPGIPMNLLSLSQIGNDTQWRVRYEHEMGEFVMRTNISWCLRYITIFTSVIWHHRYTEAIELGLRTLWSFLQILIWQPLHGF